MSDNTEHPIPHLPIIPATIYPTSMLPKLICPISKRSPIVFMSKLYNLRSFLQNLFKKTIGQSLESTAPPFHAEMYVMEWVKLTWGLSTPVY